MKTKRMICLCLSALLLMGAGCTAASPAESNGTPSSSSAASKKEGTSSGSEKPSEASSGSETPSEASSGSEKPTEAPSDSRSEIKTPVSGTPAESAAGEAPSAASADGSKRLTDGTVYEGRGYSEEAAVADGSPTVPASDGFIGEPGTGTPGSPDTPTSPEPGIGVLTAGEWNDNLNWGFFSGLINADKITFPSYGIDPRFRTMVTVTSESKQPVCAASVQLLDEKGTVLWQGMTDKNGIVYLFHEQGQKASAVKVLSGSVQKVFKVETPVQDSQSSGKSFGREMAVTVADEGRHRKKMEIMFIVDSTGSMGDEIIFLQKEFTGIAEKLGTETITYSVNFYRDLEDDYVTKCSPFTSDIKEVQDRLNQETADGGGDLPEAVDRIFEETLQKGDWHEDTVKLAFLIFDAPPHEGVEESLKKSVRAAAEKGIRIVPVVSSNSDRNTELFARAVAVVTGGTYVFLTDDSHVGESHLEPIIGEYTVEKLYDVIIRVAQSYQE